MIWPVYLSVNRNVWGSNRACLKQQIETCTPLVSTHKVTCDLCLIWTKAEVSGAPSGRVSLPFRWKSSRVKPDWPLEKICIVHRWVEVIFDISRVMKSRTNQSLIVQQITQHKPTMEHRRKSPSEANLTERDTCTPYTSNRRAFI